MVVLKTPSSLCAVLTFGPLEQFNKDYFGGRNPRAGPPPGALSL
jgi:hypothetical protein